MSVNSIEIVRVFFQNTGYSKEVENFLSPFILAGPSVIHEFVLKKDFSLELICEARVTFIEFLLRGNFLQSGEEAKRENVRVRLELLRLELLHTIALFRRDRIMATFVEEWIFSSGSEFVKLNDENSRLYSNDELSLIGLLETQPEIFFAL